LFKERKTKFALLSLLSALVVVSTAFAGISIYAQTDDSELTTFEEEAIAAGVDEEETGLEDDTATSAASDDDATSDDTDNATEDGSTSIADVSSLFEGLQVCNVGTAEISNETEIAAVPDEDVTPTVSVEVMTETEVAELASNDTETASVGNETSTASAECVLVGGDNETSTSGNATDGANATSTVGTSNETSIASAPESDEEILVIEGQDFVPEQVVLIFSENALLGIDDVDPDGSIEAKIPMPASSDTVIAGNDTGSTGIELRFVESGTQRTATFNLDGETLTAAAGGDIESAEAAEATTAPAPAPSDNATSTSDTSANDTNDTGASSSSNTAPQY
jgi:hypothetical protein